MGLVARDPLLRKNWPMTNRPIRNWTAYPSPVRSGHQNSPPVIAP